MTWLPSKPVSGPAAWRVRDIETDPVHQITPQQAAELVDVARRVRMDPESLASTRFPSLLPSLAPLMAQVREQLKSGRGVSLLRGVPVSELSVEECSVAYWAIGSFLGEGVSQSSAGELIGQVRYRGAQRLKTRGYQSKDALNFHVDLADIVGLLCVRQARSGGYSLTTSSLAVFNEVLATRPHLLEAIADGFHWSRNNEEVPGESAYSRRIPVFLEEQGLVSCRFNPSMMRLGATQSGKPLTPLQEEALATIDEIAARPEFCYRSLLEPGDIQFLNNYTALHSRTAFEDWDEPARQRLLLRLWIRDPDLRPFGDCASLMRDEPLVYNRQGRLPRELLQAA